MFVLKLMCPNIEERWVPSERPRAHGDLAVQLPLTLRGDAAAGLGRALQQHQSRDLILSPQRCRAPKHMGMPECMARTGVSTLRKGISEEAASYHLEMQSCWEREKEAVQIAGSFQSISCLLWYFGGVA